MWTEGKIGKMLDRQKGIYKTEGEKNRKNDRQKHTKLRSDSVFTNNQWGQFDSD